MVEPRRRVFALAALLLGLSALPAAAEPAAAPTAEEILARYAEAKGGLSAWRRIESLSVEGTYTSFSEPAPFTLVRRRPDAYRFETTMLGEPLVEASDGVIAWTSFPGAGLDWPVRRGSEEAQAIVVESELEPPLLDWRAKGHRVELVGRSDFDGIHVWELRVERAQGFEETWYLDATTFLEVGRVAPVTDFGRPHTQRMFFDDHRPVEGAVMPFYVETEFFLRHRIVEINRVTVNPPAGDALFALPPPEPMAELASLAGEWSVKMETRPAPQAPWSEQAAEATIRSSAGGALLEETISYELSGRRVTAVRTLSFDRFAEVFRWTHFDDFTAHQNVFEGKLEEGRLTADNLKTGTTWMGYDQTFHGRNVLSGVTADGFSVEWESSTDGGETWTPFAKLTYSRR